MDSPYTRITSFGRIYLNVTLIELRLTLEHYNSLTSDIDYTGFFLGVWFECSDISNDKRSSYLSNNAFYYTGIKEFITHYFTYLEVVAIMKYAYFALHKKNYTKKNKARFKIKPGVWLIDILYF